MNLQIAFEPWTADSALSRLVITVGDASVRSPPMSADGHYGDLFAIRNFLSQKTLTSIMLGNEPLAAIEFSSEGDVVTLKPYRRLKEPVTFGNFCLSQGIRQIDKVLDSLSTVISTDRALLEQQTFEDIDAGVYDGCEAGTGKAR